MRFVEDNTVLSVKVALEKIEKILRDNVLALSSIARECMLHAIQEADKGSAEIKKLLDCGKELESIFKVLDTRKVTKKDETIYQRLLDLCKGDVKIAINAANTIVAYRKEIPDSKRRNTIIDLSTKAINNINGIIENINVFVKNYNKQNNAKLNFKTKIINHIQ